MDIYRRDILDPGLVYLCGISYAAQKERNCSKYLKNNKIQSDASVKHRTPKLKELNVEEYSPGGDGNETKKKNVNSCPFCNLQSHLQTHSGLKPYHCPFCVKTYIWSSDYRKHIRTHTGEKPYVCDTCGKDFIRSSDLRKHERNMHTNNKPFPCTHCGKTFNKPLSLKRHERKHLGERPFSCPDCGKAFALASRMAEHQKIHTGVRPYCDKSFQLLRMGHCYIILSKEIGGWGQLSVLNPPNPAIHNK
uniref:Zinc finger protein 648 n=1 Tax=Dicentrarchus labrax TaxID=13489 RepID=A0A8P4GA12_DICLA